MIPQFNTDDSVLVFGKYEGTILEQNEYMLIIYCPEYNSAEPYLAVSVDDVVLIEPSKTKLIS